jgi:hypothetical protein
LRGVRRRLKLYGGPGLTDAAFCTVGPRESALDSVILFGLPPGCY